MVKFRKTLSAFISGLMIVNSMSVFSVVVNAEGNEHTFIFDGYTIEYEVTNSWNTTDVVSLTINNTGSEAIEDWMLYFDPNGDIQYVVDGSLTTTDGVTYIKNAGFNSTIAPNSSVTFSYAVDDCTEIPDNYIFCQTRKERTSGYSVSLFVDETWSDSFIGRIRIQNTSNDPIELWELMVDTNFTISTITNSWAASILENNNGEYTLKGTYTSYIAPNSYMDLGFTGIMNGTPAISDFSLTEMVFNEDIPDYLDFLYLIENWDSASDTDNDGLPDDFEDFIGTDPLLADSDSDRLPDGYEYLTLSSDPTDANSLDSVLTDDYFDSDNDGLNNYTEYILGSNPLNTDTDNDTISDGNEYTIYHTNPLSTDTDGDSLSDYDEIQLNLDPLSTVSENDGTNDSERKFQQSLTYTETNNTLPIEEVSVSFSGTGYINSNTTIEKDDSNVFVSDLVGIIGSPFKFESCSDFDSADISFTVDLANTSLSSVQDTCIVWYDEKFQKFRYVDCTYNISDSTISATVPHFSTYCVVDKSAMMAAQSNIFFTAAASLSDNDNDGIPDCYEASDKNNPENEFVLSNGSTTFSLINEPNSDKQTTSDTIYEVETIESNNITYYTDGLLDGEEIVFCTVGDANCDGVIDSSDISLLQSYLSGNDELTDIGLSNADCNFDGEITALDISQINYFITHGYNNSSNLDLGDLNNDGIVNSTDLALLVNHLLGVTPLNPIYELRADFTGDGQIDINDFILMKNYLISNSTSVIGLSYFYYISDPMKNDTDDDKDWDQADPEPTVHQLNGNFASKLGELQEAAQEYLLASGNNSDSDGRYFNSKDIWLSFYYIRIFNPLYANNKWDKTAGKDSGFNNYIITNHSEISNYFSNLLSIYATETGDTEDVRHFAAVISALYYYPTIKELLPDNLPWWKRFGAEIGLNRYKVNNELDILASWGGDLQQLLNEAYESSLEGSFASKVGSLFAVGQQFSSDDAYADVDGEIIAYELKKGEKSLTNQVNSCFKAKRSERFNNFSAIVDFDYSKVLYAEKIDLAEEYDRGEEYRIFKYPNSISNEDYQSAAQAFVISMQQFFSEV